MSKQVGVLKRPLLAICVPTYNRAPSLRKLLTKLVELKDIYGDQLEICISNNGSTDETRAVIEAFEQHWPIQVQHQSTNIGGTLNIISVAGQVSARWGIWCGDDDEIDFSAIERVMSLLQTLPPETWLLVDSKDSQGNCQYMHKFAEGIYTPANFRQKLLYEGLDSLGFMCTHVFPRSMLPMFQALQLSDARPWPHMVGLLRYLSQSDVSVCVLHQAVTSQAGSGIKLFWSAGDLARLHLSKLRLLNQIHNATNSNFIFLYSLMLGELYALGKLKLLLLWKLCENRDFNTHAILEFRELYQLFGTLQFLTWPHYVLVLFLNQASKKSIKKIFEASKKIYLRRLYVFQKRKYRVFDGMQRGI